MDYDEWVDGEEAGLVANTVRAEWRKYALAEEEVARHVVAALRSFFRRKYGGPKELPHISPCPACMGTGIIEVPFDPSPPGVSLSPGYLLDDEECPECGGSGITEGSS
ncbi:MAG: hypothetical protein V3W28_06225 [Thermoplasmata archaeon]